ncbi:MAG: hypothetical protein AAF466_08740 [Bacteroidota bacterium]
MKTKYISYLLRVAVLAYLLLSFYYFLGKPVGGGDEALFIADLELIRTSGWSAAIEKGISLPYMMLAYPLSLVFEPFVALRGINILLFFGLLIYFFRIRKIKDLDFYALLLFFFSTVGYFMAGTNDTLFVAGLVIFLVETHRVLEGTEKASLFWWGLGFVIAFFTRELILVFAPVIVLALFLILKLKKARLRTLSVPLIVAVVLVLLNLPSLSENGSLSYDKKLPPETTEVTWAQRQYYAQLLVNQGKIPNYNHPNWKQTETYLKTHGQDALPRTVGDALFFDPGLTVKEFFKDFLDIVIYGGRQLALVLPIILLYLLITWFKGRRWSAHLFVPTAVLVMMCVFALIIISFVELRWLAPVFIAAIFYFYVLKHQSRIPKLLVQANYLFTSLLCLYGMYGMITKL